MTEPESSYRCARCTMSFTVAKCPRRAAVTRCRECHLLFWHADRYGTGRVTVGITPDELLQQGVEGVA